MSRVAKEATFAFLYAAGTVITGGRYLDNFLDYQRGRKLLPTWKALPLIFMAIPIGLAWPIFLPLMEYNARRKLQ